MKNGPYTLVIAPEDYPSKKYRGRYCYEHHLKYWKWFGKSVPKGYEIHHKNGNHRDNRKCNLMLLTSAEHRRHHGDLLIEKYKRPAKCPTCKIIFFRRGGYIRRKQKRNPRGIFCSKVCADKANTAFAGRIKWAKYIEKICKHCSNKFERLVSDCKRKSNIFCSRKCYLENVKGAQYFNGRKRNC